MTVYGDPTSFAMDFKKCVAEYIHIVDLEGAKTGGTPNFDTVKRIKEITGLFCEIGGGIRSEEAVEKYLAAGLDRVILGTAAVRDEKLVEKLTKRFGDKIAVGADVKDGFVAVKGWTEKSDRTLFDFCEKMIGLGVETFIVTDVSKDGAMKGTNREMYRELADKLSVKIIASGGVSTLEDVRYLKSLGLYGAIVGKAYYTKAIDLAEAIEVAK